MRIVLVAAAALALLTTFVLMTCWRREGYSDSVPGGGYHLNFKTKCASCEADVISRHGTDAVWLANPAKTFSAEVDGVRQAGGAMCGGYMGKTVRFSNGA